MTNGNIRYQLKIPPKDGTTHVIFEPLDFMARFAALVPKPRVNLTRFARIIPDTRLLCRPAKAVQIRSGRICHGVFAGAPDRPISKHRALVTPVKRGKGDKRQKTVKQMTVHPQNVTPR